MYVREDRIQHLRKEDFPRLKGSSKETLRYPPEYFRPPKCVSCRREIIQPAMMVFKDPPICIWCWAD